ncbi:MAG TPA: hypothetical protein VEA80_01305 [Vitreimonas sp.]|uniref:hypothetical protein n=1 Tax=Vitreimonas sp. TaxID=3069702 RepID=UPI002D32A722|nr:hypothetical protein [Vitreimonas sp.]HYD86088.1 hypothetical protein [Vitreimonas sp.]
MSAEIWRHLGIAETADEAEVRRAYAERLKRTNPEDDPEGFKRLRNAYERALQIIRWRVRYAAIEPVEDSGESVLEAAGPVAVDGAAPAQAESAAAETREPPPRDEVLEAHDAACRRLEAAIRDGASPWEMQAAFQALVSGAAMERLGVYVETERWLADVLRRYGHGGPVLEAAVAHFKWEDRSHAVGDRIGAGMLAFREGLAEDAKTRAFIARVRDRRHEFHAAYKEATRPLSERSWLSRLVSFPRIGLMRRFYDYIDDKIPYAEDELDYEAGDWWRRRAAFWRRPLSILTWLMQIGVVVGVIALFVVLAPPSAPDANSANMFEVRRACAQSVEQPAANGAACASFLERAPESLLMRQYAGIIALREDRAADAAAHFELILRASPVDAAARYGYGLALSRSADPSDQELGLGLMRQALAVDDAVSIYFAQYGVVSGTVLAPAESAVTFPETQMPRFDTPPSDIGVEGRSVFDQAYAHFGIADHFGDGSVVVQCLARTTGAVTDCQIVEETPLNGGRGEVALRVMASATVTPARLGGQPVDGVPVRVPVRFALE